MCGIAGILQKAPSLGSDEFESLLTRISLSMFTRGPDDSGVWSDPEAGIGFGHRRLSIVDLAPTGSQPMTSNCGRFVITYNGEVYNHGELSKALTSAGVQFRGHSDTEVLIESIATWGLASTLERIDGMFGFGIWDKSTRTLTLARDRAGEKPLYYATLKNGDFAFASSLDALRLHPDFDSTIDNDSIASFLRYKYIPAPHTAFVGARKLEPGHVVTIGPDAVCEVPVPYWSAFETFESIAPFAGSPNDAVDELERLMRVSVRRRMDADVPVGAFLSGGIDSSTVVALAQQESNENVRTFTIGSTSTEFDESSLARSVANHLGTDHTEMIVTESDALGTISKLAASHDEPFADSSQIPTRLVCEMAREHVTVALSGDAGDELFGGYNRYLWVPKIWSQLEKAPAGVRKAARALLERVPPRAFDRAASLLPDNRRPRQLGLKVSKVAGVADASSAEEVFNRLVSHWTDPAALINNGSERSSIHSSRGRWPQTDNIVDHMMLVDLMTFLPDDILTKVDRAAMAVSLETRIPLLDKEIIEFALSLPQEFMIRDGVGKWPLRQVLSRHVPPDLFERPKSGFGVPIGDWLRGELRGWGEELLFGEILANSVDIGIVQKTWDDHQRGLVDNTYPLWDLLMLSDWCAHRGISSF